MFDGLESSHVIYVLVFGCGLFTIEAIRLLFFSEKSYRESVNHRLRMMREESDREAILLQLRRERGLDGSGGFILPITALNRLIVQSGVRLGLGRIAAMAAMLAVATAATTYGFLGIPAAAGAAGLVAGFGLPLFALSFLRSRRHRKFGEQFPEAIDVIVRSLKAGHPVPVAVGMVAREMPDPIGSEFGMVADEITYGADLESAMRSLHFRVGQADLHLFVTAVAIQTTTGGNLREILQNLATVIRDRIKMRRKVKSVSAEGRSAAMILSALPLIFFALIQFTAPHFYGNIWNTATVQYGLSGAAGWMLVGILIMYKMTQFRI